MYMTTTHIVYLRIFGAALQVFSFSESLYATLDDHDTKVGLEKASCASTSPLGAECAAASFSPS